MLQAPDHFFHSEQRSSAVACLRFLLMAFALNMFSCRGIFANKLLRRHEW